MSAHILDFDMTFTTWEFTSRELDLQPNVIAYIHPYSPPGASQAYVQNMVWDSVKGGYHIWETTYRDIDGLEYDGPGSYGVDTSNYVVLTISYGELS